MLSSKLTRRWFIHEGGKLGFNEPQWGDSGHCNFAGRGDAYDAQGREEKNPRCTGLSEEADGREIGQDSGLT